MQWNEILHVDRLFHDNIRTTIDYVTRAPKTFIIKLFSSIEGYDYKEIRQMPLFLRGRLEQTNICMTVHVSSYSDHYRLLDQGP